MTYTSIKITDSVAVLNSECPKCGFMNSSVLRKDFSLKKRISVQCGVCRTRYRTTAFSGKWRSSAHKADKDTSIGETADSQG